MLLKGGNAIDAAVAAAITLTIVEPTNNGLGGDLFAIVWDGRTCHGLNASGRSPTALDAERILGEGEMPRLGWDTVTVPGAVSGWAALSERFGALDFEDLFGPAVTYAEKGFPVGPSLAVDWAEAVADYSDFPTLVSLYTRHGSTPNAGDMFALPDHARTLKQIANTRGETLYRGDLAVRIADHARRDGGTLREEDLARHRARWIEPISLDYRSVRVHELPPNGQGIAVLIALGILQRTPYADHPVNSPTSLHYEIEAMKLAFNAVHKHVADPVAMVVGTQELLNPEHLEHQASTIRPDHAQDPGHTVPRTGGTVYVTAGDASGLMVSLIQSTYFWFGSGVVIPGTGIGLQNRGACFTCEPGHPNLVAPGKLPFHTIIPAFVTDRNGAVCSFGLVGGSMQPQGHLQLVTRLEVHGENPQAALAAPRWRFDGGMNVAVESAIDPDVVSELRKRGHCVTVVDETSLGWHGFGTGQTIVQLDDAYVAASDPRGDGQAVGF